MARGSLAARRPGPHPVRPLTYSAFVDEEDRAPFFVGFFLWRASVRAASGGSAHASHRTLTTPARIVQDLPDMAGVIRDAQLVVDADAPPARRSKAGFPSPASPGLLAAIPRGVSDPPPSVPVFCPARPSSVPPGRRPSAQRLTVWRHTCTRRATSDGLRAPFSNRRTASKRRFSSATKSRLTPAGLPIKG